MSEEFAMVAPKVVIPPEVVQPPEQPAPLPGVTVEAPRPEQVRAAEAYFTHEEEHRAVAGLWGMWASTLLLHDLAVDHFEGRDEADEKRNRKRASTEESPQD